MIEDYLLREDSSVGKLAINAITPTMDNVLRRIVSLLGSMAPPLPSLVLRPRASEQ